MSLTFQLSERCLPFLPLKPNNHETNPTCNSQKKMGWVKSQWDCRFEGADQKVAVLKRPTMFVFIMFWVPWRLLIVLENSLMYISEQHTIQKYWTKNDYFIKFKRIFIRTNCIAIDFVKQKNKFRFKQNK